MPLLQQRRQPPRAWSAHRHQPRRDTRKSVKNIGALKRSPLVTNQQDMLLSTHYDSYRGQFP